MHAKHQDSETSAASRSVERWRMLSNKLESREAKSCVEQLWPKTQPISFYDALQVTDDDREDKVEEIRSFGKQLIDSEIMAKTPIAAVVGMLNSGKTSLVASFLSKHGQQRVLRGDANREGTHRFVLWVPEAWRKQPDSWSMLHELLSGVFGSPPEELADDTEDSHAQYNNREQGDDRFGVPLLATDPSLDQLGLGLLDCPDVQSGTFSTDGEVTNVRLEFVAKAARLCSAFVIVTSLSDARDGTLEHITTVVGERMPGVARFMAVNRVRPRYTPAQVRNDLDELLTRHNIAKCFGAYNFEIPDSQKFTPPLPSDIVQGDGEPLPVFYELSEHDEQNPPAQIPSEKYLSQLAHGLDKETMFSDQSKALWRNLVDAVKKSMKRIEQHADEQLKKSATLLQVVSAATLDCMGRRDESDQVVELRPLVTPAIARQLIDAITEQAPWYLKPGLWLNKSVRNTVSRVKEWVSRLNPAADAVEQARETGDKIKEMGRKITGSGHGEVITPERLARALRAEGFSELVKLDKEAVEEKCGRIIERFRRDNETSLDVAKLDEAVKEMWKKVPWKKKLTAGVTSLATFVMSIGAAMMLPIDMGANLLLAASLQELALAAGVSGIVTYLVGGKTLKAAEMEAGLIQLGDLYAITCDEFGLPRSMEGEQVVVEINGQQKNMSTSQLEVLLPLNSLVNLWHVRRSFSELVNSILDESG